MVTESDVVMLFIKPPHCVVGFFEFFSVFSYHNHLDSCSYSYKIPKSKMVFVTFPHPVIFDCRAPTVLASLQQFPQGVLRFPTFPVVNFRVRTSTIFYFTVGLALFHFIEEVWMRPSVGAPVKFSTAPIF